VVIVDKDWGYGKKNRRISAVAVIADRTTCNNAIG